MVQDSVSDWSQAWLFSKSPRLPVRSWRAPAAAYLETRVLPSSTTSGGLEPALTASTTAGGALPVISQMVRVRGPDWALDWSPSPEEPPHAAAPRARARAKARVARAR